MCFFSEYKRGRQWTLVALCCGGLTAMPHGMLGVFHAAVHAPSPCTCVQQLLPTACRQAQVQVAYALDPPACRAAFNRTHPYVLERDLTIRTSEPPELGQMDFVFLMRKVLIAPNVTLTLEQVVLRNVNKLGGFGLDFFMVSSCAAVP
jgi:hypothetical protein